MKKLNSLKLSLFSLLVAFILMGCAMDYGSKGTEGNFCYAYSEEDFRVIFLQ